jgi:hypothetical protein
VEHPLHQQVQVHLPANRQVSVHPVPANQESAAYKSRVRSRSTHVILAEPCADYCLGPRFDKYTLILLMQFPR